MPGTGDGVTGRGAGPSSGCSGGLGRNVRAEEPLAGPSCPGIRAREQSHFSDTGSLRGGGDLLSFIRLFFFVWRQLKGKRVKCMAVVSALRGWG